MAKSGKKGRLIILIAGVVVVLAAGWVVRSRLVVGDTAGAADSTAADSTAHAKGKDKDGKEKSALEKAEEEAKEIKERLAKDNQLRTALMILKGLTVYSEQMTDDSEAKDK